MKYVNITTKKCIVNTWWWNSGVRDEIQKKNKHIKNLQNIMHTIIMHCKTGSSKLMRRQHH